MTDEVQIAGAGYILTFFNDIEQLNSYYASYVNTILSLKHKYPDTKNLENISDEDRQTLINMAQGLRTWIIRCYIKAQALKDKVDAFNNQKLDDSYKKATSTFILDPKDAEEFVVEINKAFADGVLVDLLSQARDIYARLTG